MIDSAPGLRERRRVQTATQVTQVARRLTAERGLAGFTVEELCDEVGISRRTLFNYFASKEDAVLGLGIRRGPDDHEARFLAGGGGTRLSNGLTATLIDDLAELLIGHVEVVQLGTEDLHELITAARREPRLFGRMMAAGRGREAADIALVERRESLDAGDPLAAAAVEIVGAIMRTSVEQFLRPDNTHSFRELFARRLTATRAVFAA